MSKLVIINTVDKKTEVSELTDELKKKVHKLIDDGMDGEAEALQLVANVVQEWIVEAMILASEFEKDDSASGSGDH